MSDITKKYRQLALVFGILSVVSMFAPMGVWVIKGFLRGTPLTKVTLTGSFMIALVVFLIGLVNKHKPRCVLWILLLGVYVALGNIKALLVLVAVCTTLDELVFTPLHKYFRSKYSVNKEIDKRL